MNEVDLAKRAIKRDEQAFLEIIHLYKESLYRTAFAFLKNGHESVEAIQEVTVRAYKKIHTVKEPRYVKTWLIRIMMNYCQDQLRKKKQTVQSDKLYDFGSEMDYTYLEIEEAIATLPEVEQRLIHLMYFQDIKIKDIAVIESIPVGTVKSRLHKTLRTLRSFLSDKGDVDHV